MAWPCVDHQASSSIILIDEVDQTSLRPVLDVVGSELTAFRAGDPQVLHLVSYRADHILVHSWTELVPGCLLTSSGETILPDIVSIGWIV